MGLGIQNYVDLSSLEVNATKPNALTANTVYETIAPYGMLLHHTLNVVKH